MVNTIRVVGVDQTVADSSAHERLEGNEAKKGIWGRGDSHVESISPWRSLQESPCRIQDQEGRQEYSQQASCELDQKYSPLLCRLRMNLRDQDRPNIFLQDYRCVVTVIRQEDVGVDNHGMCSSPFCGCGSSCQMPRKEEGSAHKRTKPQMPAPKGAASSADERAKADKEAQRVERGQAKLKALQHATDSAKAPMRSQDTASDTSTRQKTAKLTDKPASSTQASSSGVGDTPIPQEKAVVRKRPAQSEDETAALPSTPAESETSQSATTTVPQQADQSVEESQSSQVDPQQGNNPVEETQTSQPDDPTIQGSSNVKKRMTRKGSASIAEQGSIGSSCSTQEHVTCAKYCQVETLSRNRKLCGERGFFPYLSVLCIETTQTYCCSFSAAKMLPAQCPRPTCCKRPPCSLT